MDHFDTYVCVGMVVVFGCLYVRDLIVAACSDIEGFHAIDEERGCDD